MSIMLTTPGLQVTGMYLAGRLLSAAAWFGCRFGCCLAVALGPSTVSCREVVQISLLPYLKGRSLPRQPLAGRRSDFAVILFSRKIVEIEMRLRYHEIGSSQGCFDE